MAFQKFVQFLDEFNRANEDPLDSNGWDAPICEIVSRYVTSVQSNARALNTTNTPANPDVEIAALVSSAVQNVATSVLDSHVVAGNVVTFTYSAGHGRKNPLGGRVTFSGMTSTPDINGSWEATFTTDQEFTVDFGQLVSISVLGSFATSDAFTSVVARVDEDTTVGTWPPVSGYRAILTWAAAGVRNLSINKWELNSDGVAIDDIEGVTGTVTLQSSGGSDLDVLQELRLLVVTKDDHTLVRAFVNNDDNENPSATYLDRKGVSSAAGKWGFELGAPGTVLDSFSGEDRVDTPETDASAGLTLKSMRDNVKLELSRGSTDNVPDATLDQWINDALYEFKQDLGDMAVFTQREETLSLEVDGEGTTYLPDYVERVHGFYDSTTLRKIDFQLVARTSTHGLIVNLLNAQRSTTLTLKAIINRKLFPLLNDTDQCAIPRQYEEVVRLGAVLRLTSRNTDPSWFQSVVMRYRERLRTAKKDMARIQTMENPSFRVRRRRDARGRWRVAPSGDVRLLRPF